MSIDEQRLTGAVVGQRADDLAHVGFDGADIAGRNGYVETGQQTRVLGDLDCMPIDCPGRRPGIALTGHCKDSDFQSYPAARALDSNDWPSARYVIVDKRFVREARYAARAGLS